MNGGDGGGSGSTMFTFPFHSKILLRPSLLPTEWLRAFTLANVPSHQLSGIKTIGYCRLKGDIK